MDPPPLKEFPGSRGNGGTGQSSASITHLKRCPRACADGVLSRPLGDSRCHGSHPPPPGLLTTRCPRLSAASHRLRPGCDGCHRSGSVHPPGRLPLGLNPAAPRPTPQPAASPLPSAPPPPSPAAAAATAARSVTSAPACPALPHCAAAGAEDPPLRVKGRSRFRPRGTVLPSRALAGHPVPAAAASGVREASVTPAVDGRHGQGSREREGPAFSSGAL